MFVIIIYQPDIVDVLVHVVLEGLVVHFEVFALLLIIDELQGFQQLKDHLVEVLTNN